MNQIVSALLTYQLIQFGLSVLVAIALLYLFTNEKTRPFMEKGLKKIFDFQKGLLEILSNAMK